MFSRRRRNALVALAILVVGGALVLIWYRTPMRLYKDNNEMRAEVLRHVPLGTPIAEAQRSMDANRFSCVLEEGFVLSSLPWTRRVYCWRSRLLRDWRVSLFLDSRDTVVDVDVASGVTMP